MHAIHAHIEVVVIAGEVLLVCPLHVELRAREARASIEFWAEAVRVYGGESVIRLIGHFTGVPIDLLPVEDYSGLGAHAGVKGEDAFLGKSADFA